MFACIHVARNETLTIAVFGVIFRIARQVLLTSVSNLFLFYSVKLVQFILAVRRISATAYLDKIL